MISFDFLSKGTGSVLIDFCKMDFEEMVVLPDVLGVAIEWQGLAKNVLNLLELWWEPGYREEDKINFLSSGVRNIDKIC